MGDWDNRLGRLRSLLEADEDIVPTDLVDEWAAWRPPREMEYGESETRMVDVDRIVGTDPMNVDRLVERRLVRIVNTMVEGNWKPRYNRVVLARHPDGDYYVTADGNHRVLVHKFVGIDRIYAEVTPYEYP